MACKSAQSSMVAGPSWRPAPTFLTAHLSLQEHKLIVKREELPQAQQELQDRLDSGLDYNTAASTVYQDYGRPGE